MLTLTPTEIIIGVTLIGGIWAGCLALAAINVWAYRHGQRIPEQYGDMARMVYWLAIASSIGAVDARAARRPCAAEQFICVVLRRRDRAADPRLRHGGQVAESAAGVTNDSSGTLARRVRLHVRHAAVTQVGSLAAVLMQCVWSDDDLVAPR
jgi:hypothetical protein